MFSKGIQKRMEKKWIKVVLDRQLYYWFVWFRCFRVQSYFASGMLEIQISIKICWKNVVPILFSSMAGLDT